MKCQAPHIKSIKIFWSTSVENIRKRLDWSFQRVCLYSASMVTLITSRPPQISHYFSHTSLRGDIPRSRVFDGPKLAPCLM
jgi:hypothetical protein